MTLSARLETLIAVVETGVLPLFYSDDADRARGIVGALREGGIRVIEFTDRGPNAGAVFAALTTAAARHDRDAILGAGSIRDPFAADRFIAAGARFIVGPSFDAEVARLCNRRRIPYIPGCATPTEIVTAEESGSELVKVFPGDALGPAFVKAIRGPLPDTQVVVTGGVAATEDSVNQWIAAGAVCLGFGSALVTRRHTDPASDADLSELTPAAAALIDLVAAARAANGVPSRGSRP
jgi:2-dehydro-3-deoxyphosphogluconate aldolase / (4S)-4-hydroxy-2-oxoglutarate aldolase